MDDQGFQRDTTQGVPGSPSRRRLLRGGLSAAPVVLTLASAPVAAGQCAFASSFVSAAAGGSRAAAGVQLCSGRSPNDWASSLGAWPAGVKRVADSNGAADTFTGRIGPLLTSAIPSTVSLQELLVNHGSSIEAHVTAVWLSAYAGLLQAPFADGAAVQALWSSIHRDSGLRYGPGATQLLSLEETKVWLARTWSV